MFSSVLAVLVSCASAAVETVLLVDVADDITGWVVSVIGLEVAVVGPGFTVDDGSVVDWYNVISVTAQSNSRPVNQENNLHRSQSFLMTY